MSDSTGPGNARNTSPLTRVWRAPMRSRQRRRASVLSSSARWTIAALASAQLAATAAETGSPAPPPPAALRASPSTLAGGWLLSRAPIPGSERSSVALLHAVDPMRSDIGIAGLMLRCSEAGFDTILVVVTPYPPSAAPQVTIASGAESRTFAASVLPTGAALALPAAASDLARTVWRGGVELSVSISDDGATLNGVIPIPNLDAALRTLMASCSAP